MDISISDSVSDSDNDDSGTSSPKLSDSPEGEDRFTRFVIVISWHRFVFSLNYFPDTFSID